MKIFIITTICTILLIICSISHFINHRILIGCIYLLLSFLWGLITYFEYKLDEKQKKGKSK